MNKEVIEQKIKDQLNIGLSKQTVYENLVKIHPDKANYLKRKINSSSSKKLKRKYWLPQVILIFLILFQFVSDVRAFNFWLAGLDIACLLVISFYEFRYYWVLALRMIWLIADITTFVLTFSDTLGDTKILLILMTNVFIQLLFYGIGLYLFRQMYVRERI